VTTALDGQEIARKLAEQFPDPVTHSDKTTVIVKSEALYKVAEFLKNTSDYDFDFLADLTSVDYTAYFEVVYHLMSLEHNHSLTLKARVYDRENPVVPSVFSLWRSADYQEREIFDLMGITFEGHPNMKRLFLWEGFNGHPLRRDYL
jgi:NADH-quinone oxidoreductase subunit C